MRIAILTVSDSTDAGTREDRSGPSIAAWAAERHYEVTERAVVPDDAALIARTLTAWGDADIAELVLTTGGTGLAPRDVTPEATAAVLQRLAPGIPELLRTSAAARVPTAVLSRGLAGVRGRTLIINLPGSPGGVRDGLAMLSPIIDHAVGLIRGTETTHD